MANYLWTGAAGDGSVANAANWSVGGLTAATPPGSGDVAFFNSSAGTLVGTGTVADLQFQNSGPWAVGGALTATGSVVATMSPLTVLAGGTLTTALIDAAAGFTVANGGSVAAELLTTQTFSGIASTPDLLLQSGAKVTLSGMPTGSSGTPIALEVTNTGTVDGAALSGAGGEAIVSGAGATLRAQGGATVSALSTFLGARSGETGSLTLTGAGTAWSDVVNATISHNTGASSGIMIVGAGTGTGHLTITAQASLTDGGLASVGDGAGGSGDATVSQSGSWSVGGVLDVGNGGTGTLAISSGGKVGSGGSGSSLSGAGINAGAHGTITVDGTGSSWTSSSQTVIGFAGTGSLAITNGGSVGETGSIFAIGQSAAGTVSVDGAGSALTDAGILDIGFGGAGALTVGNGGSVVAAGAFYVGYSAGSAGTLTIDAGGVVRTTQAAQATNITVGIGLGAASGATAAATGSVTVQGAGALLDANGNPLAIGLHGAGTLTVGAGGTVRAGTPDGLQAASMDLGEAADGTGTLTVLSGGTVTLSGRAAIGDLGHGSASVAGGLTISGGALQVGVQGTGSLSVAGLLTGAELDVGVASAGSGRLDVSGSVTLSGALLVGEQGAAQESIAAGGSVTASLATVGARGALSLAGGALHTTGTISVASGGSVAGAGTLDGAVLNNGTVMASVAGASLALTGAAAGTGALIVADGATLAVAGAVAMQQHVTLGAGGSTLTLGNAGGFAGTIDGFQQGDTIALLGADVGSSSVSGDQLVLFDHMGAQVAALTFATAAQAASAIVPTGTGVVDITAGMPCFAEGTRIATTRGTVAVERLRVGDRAVLAGGGTSAVRWIGHRLVDVARHPRPDSVRPVRIRRHAFGPGLPHADVLLSPDHAVFIPQDGVLIPVRHLIDGAAILPAPLARVRYFHVELDRHDVILADGLPVESYLETGARAMFENGGAPMVLHADFASYQWEAEGCAPLVVTGPILAAARARLAHARKPLQRMTA